MSNECDEESEDRYTWLELARGGFPLPRMAAFKFAANKPRCLFLRCFLSCNTSVPLEKIFSWLTRWTFGSFEQLSIRFVFILDKVCRGMQSNFSRRKVSNYLLWWNRQKPSTYTVLSTCSIVPGQAQASNEKIYIVITRLSLSHYENLNSNTFYKQGQEFES